MTFFVDANVLIYSAVVSHYRESCVEILEAIADGRAEGRTSTAVLEEVWHIELSGRVGRIQGLTAHLYTLFTPLLSVTDEAFRIALSLQTLALGANDRLHVGTCLAHGIQTFVSADADFEHVQEVRRIDPLDLHARRTLLGV